MKSAPQRMCLACRQMKDKRELVRIVKSGDQIKLDRTDKAQGRGAYVCRSAQCLAKLGKHKLLNRAFKCEVPQDVYLELEGITNEG